MDNSLRISTITSTSSTFPRENQHITIASKLTDISRRIKYARKVITEEGALKYGGCTEERTGPPTFLKEPLATKWKEEVRRCVNLCVWRYLLPAYTDKLEYYTNILTTNVGDKLTEENRERIERGLQLGKDRINNKWDRREGISLQERNKKETLKIGPHKVEEIGTLRRGELPLAQGERLVVKQGIQQTDNVYKLLAHAIHGSVRFYKIVYRNVWKYIEIYEDVEKNSFKPHWGRLSNNTDRWISSWSMFCSFIKNRDLIVTTFELDIISKLYDINIKVFREIDGSQKCTWKAKINTNREVNILVTLDNKWSLLHKIVIDKTTNQNTEATEIRKESLDKETQVDYSELLTSKEGRTELVEVQGTQEDKTKQIGEKDKSIKKKRKSNSRNDRKRIFWQLWRKKCREKKRSIDKSRVSHFKKVEIKEKNKQLVFDYTTEGLSQAEIELLSKGESFCVTNHKVDVDRLKTDIYNYARRLRLHEEFREPKVDSQKRSTRGSIITQTPVDTQNNFSPITQTPIRSSLSNRGGSTQSSQLRSSLYNSKDVIRKPASLYDPESQNRNLNRYIHCIQEESLLTIKDKVKFKDNITKEHRLALQTLKDKIDNRKIIISKADKGSGLVAVDYETYISKGTKYVEEEAKAYLKVSENEKAIVNKLVKSRNNIVLSLKNNKVIEVETATYCTRQLEEKLTGLKFYFKVHKDSNIQTMPLRPLQSCINAPTHHLSQVLTDILQPLLQSKLIPTYIQDSNQLLFRLDKLDNLSSTDTLISSDVAALYPSIPHEEGLLAISEFLEQNSTFSEAQIGSIVRALKLVIIENYVVWNDQIYKQTSGVAMGTPVAVAYANIFMHWIDGEIRQRAPFIIEHIRYIDDNLFVIPIDKIDELMQIANNILPPHIRFTYECLDRKSEKGLSFLDTLLFITQEGKIVSRLYTKKTDKHAYLLPSSYHPLHITKNIPQAVFNRIRRICSTDEWFQLDASKAVEWLEDRGYDFTIIRHAIDTSIKKDRHVLINNIEQNRGKFENNNKKTIENTYTIPFLVTYSHKTQKIKQVLKQRKGLLDASFVATKVRPRLTFRRQQNLNDIVVQKGLRGPINNKQEKVFELCGEKPRYRTNCPCRCSHNQKICRCCAHARSGVDGIKTKIRKRVDCDSKNLIYMIGCKICSKKYIGETQQKLKERLEQHLNNINKLKQPLYTHFNQVHSADNLYITVVETVNSVEAAYRKVREAWWINKLQTLEPRGFNVKLECSQVYQASQSTIRVDRTRGQNSWR